MSMSGSHHATAADAEAAFYAAFAQCDSDAMGALWARDEALCIHPGATPLIGYDAVMRSWEQIFAGAEAPSIETRVVHRIEGDDLAVHLVEEWIASASSPMGKAVVLATNIYRLIGRGWWMVSHQGSVLPNRPSREQTVQ